MTSRLEFAAKGAHSEPLSNALSMHLAQTEEHIARLEDVFDMVGKGGGGGSSFGKLLNSYS